MGSDKANPSLRRGAAIVVAYLLVSSYNQFLLLPFERATTPILQTLPTIVVAFPIVLLDVMQIATWCVFAAALAAWAGYRSSDDPLGNYRQALAIVGWCHAPLVGWACIALPAVVLLLHSFEGDPITRSTIAAHAGAQSPLQMVGWLRAWAWLGCAAMLVMMVARQEGSLRAALLAVVPPLVAVSVVFYLLITLLAG